MVLTDLQTLEDRKPEGKAGQFLFSPWALTQRQINFSFTNAQFSSEEPWPKGNPDDTQFYISTSESLTNVFEHLRKTSLQGTRWERGNTSIWESMKKTWKNDVVLYSHRCNRSFQVLLALRIQALILRAIGFNLVAFWRARSLLADPKQILAWRLSPHAADSLRRVSWRHQKLRCLGVLQTSSWQHLPCLFINICYHTTKPHGSSWLDTPAKPFQISISLSPRESEW